MKKKILILCKSNLERDPRVLKQIEALYKEYSLTCVGTYKSNHVGVKSDLNIILPDRQKSKIDKVCFIFKLLTKQYKSIYWNRQNLVLYEKLKGHKYDLIICNETELLPIANKLGERINAPIYCDLHEYYLDDRFNGRFSKSQQMYEEWILKNHISYVKHFTSVSPQIIELYYNRYNITCTLLDNACKFYELSPRLTSTNRIRLVSHGAAIPARKLELMIEAVKNLDDKYILDLYLMDNNPTYKNQLKEMVRDNKRISILDSIPFHKIQETINQYDIGLYLLFPTHLNNKFALPNKLFEFIQGRVAIVIGPTPAMADLVNEYNLGVVSKKFTSESLTEAINKMSVEDINTYKRNTNVAAVERNSDKNLLSIRKIVSDLID